MRKTVVSLAIVTGTLYTIHSIATDALKRLVPQSATITVSRESEQLGVPANREKVTSYKLKTESAATNTEAANSDSAPAHAESNTPDAISVAALESQNQETADSIERRIMSAEVPEDRHVSVLQSLQHELAAELSKVFGNFLVQVGLAVLGSCAVGGATVYKLYPTLQQRKIARQKRAAMKRRQMRATDDRLLEEEEEMANLAPPVPTRGDYS